MSEGKETAVPTATNKGLIAFLAVAGTLLLGAFILGVGFFFTAPQQSQPEKENPSGTLPKTAVPQAENFTVTPQDENNYQVTFTLPAFEENLAVEYRIANNRTRSLAEGSVREAGTVTENVTTGESDTSLTLSLRVSNGLTTSSWVVQDTQEIAEPVALNNNPGLNEEYFQTDWALKKDSSLEALTAALEIAYNATPYDEDEEGIYCGYSGDNIVNVGEIFPPSPEILPEPYTLRFTAYQRGTDNYHLYYYWCDTE